MFKYVYHMHVYCIFEQGVPIYLKKKGCNYVYEWKKNILSVLVVNLLVLKMSRSFSRIWDTYPYGKAENRDRIFLFSSTNQITRI